MSHGYRIAIALLVVALGSAILLVSAWSHPPPPPRPPSKAIVPGEEMATGGPVAATPRPLPTPTSATSPLGTAEATLVEATPLPDSTPVSLAATPAAGAMTRYSVTNPGSAPIDVQHVITDGAGGTDGASGNGHGFSYSFWSHIPAGATVEFRLKDVAEVPSPFKGSVTLLSDSTFTTAVTGYDYPGSS